MGRTLIAQWMSNLPVDVDYCSPALLTDRRFVVDITDYGSDGGTMLQSGNLIDGREFKLRDKCIVIGAYPNLQDCRKLLSSRDCAKHVVE